MHDLVGGDLVGGETNDGAWLMLSSLNRVHDQRKVDVAEHVEHAQPHGSRIHDLYVLGPFVTGHEEFHDPNTHAFIAHERVSNTEHYDSFLRSHVASFN